MTKEKEQDIKRLVAALEEAVTGFEAIEETSSLENAVSIAKQSIKEIDYVLSGEEDTTLNLAEYDEDYEPDLLDLFI